MKSSSLKCCERKDNVCPCTQLKVDRFFYLFSVELGMFRHTKESCIFMPFSVSFTFSHRGATHLSGIFDERIEIMLLVLK